MSIARKLLMGAAGAGSKTTYVDDVFSTLLWSGEFTGNAGTTREMTNGLDLAGEGGLVWIKQRNQAYSTGHQLYDTVRGAGAEKEICSSSTDIQGAGNIEQYGWLNSFNSNGFTTKGGSVDSDYVNKTGVNYTGWSFRKAPGFFDIVTYTGNASHRTISHNLGCVPGMILIKNTGSSANWIVYHRGVTVASDADPGHYALNLNTTSVQIDEGAIFWNTMPTASVFTLGNDSLGDETNGNGETYVAYLFAGGESTADTARSVDFDGSGDYLATSSSSDFTFGTGDFTIEGWVKFDNTNTNVGVCQLSDNSNGIKESTTLAVAHSASNWYLYANGIAHDFGGARTANVWYHFALVRDSSTTSFYVNGRKVGSFSDSTNYDYTYAAAGGYYNTSYLLAGNVSNFRIVKGTAVYTSSFRPPTEPLTNITNTKLLCCNNSSTTGATVAPGAITAHGNPTASIYSPFDDPEGFQFGEEGDQNIIKCGSYIGNGQANESGPFTNLGWEPQFLLIKNTSSAASWAMFDTMRGIRTGGKTQTLSANLSNAEGDYTNFATVASTGFYAGYNDVYTNSNNDNYIYMAIRSVDGLVSKPPEAGTDVFAMDTGNSSSTIPALDSDFPVGMAFYKNPAGSGDWYLSGRLMSNQRLQPDSIVSQSTDNDFVFDSNVGWYKGSYMNTTYQSWMFKRGQSFDVMTYMGNNAKRSIPHSLGRPPEMIWIKKRDANSEWAVGHKGLNGGTNPWNYRLLLSSAATGAANDYWAAPGAPNNTGTAPTSTVFSLGPVSYTHLTLPTNREV